MIAGRQLALALLVALAALLVQERAFAALLPLCEAKVEATMVSTPEPSCEVVTTVDEETGETTKAAPICDPRGASAIAPPRIHPVEDSRIEPARTCGGGDDAVVGLAPDRQDPPASNTWTLPYAAPVDPPAAMLPGPDSAGIVNPPMDGAPRTGVRRQVYHPPR